MDEENNIREEQLLRQAVIRGDERAWRILYNRCFDSLYAFIDYRTGHKRDRSEEIAQECWMVAVRRIDSYEPTRSSFGTWLRGIAVNIIRNHIRSWKRENGFEAREAKPIETNPDPSIEMTEQIGLALTTLPERYRAVLHAKYEEELTTAEIAGRWGESRKAVESLLTRARNTFREAYARLEKDS